MFFITLTLVLTICGYLYEKETIENKEDFFSFLYLYGTGTALVSAIISGILLVVANIYTDATNEAPIPSWVFLPFDTKE